MRSREMSGERRRGLVRNANAVKSTVEVKTFRCPLTNAPPKVVSRKYFCASSQVTRERAGGVTGQSVCLDSGSGTLPSSSSQGGAPVCAQGGAPVCDRLPFGKDRSVALQLEVVDELPFA